MDVKNDLGGGKPTLLIAEDEESNLNFRRKTNPQVRS